MTHDPGMQMYSEIFLQRSATFVACSFWCSCSINSGSLAVPPVVLASRDRI